MEHHLSYTLQHKCVLYLLMELTLETPFLPLRPLHTSTSHQLKKFYLRDSLRTLLHHLSLISPSPRGKSWFGRQSPKPSLKFPSSTPHQEYKHFQVAAMLTLPNMVLTIPVWYLHPPAMVPQPSLPPQSEGIPMQIPVLTLATPPSPPISSTTATAGGRRKKKEPTAPLPPRVQPPCALCEREGHPTNRCPSLPELRNLIQLPRATTSLTASPSTSSTTTMSPTTGSKGLRTKFACAICSEYGHYTHHFPTLPQFLQTLTTVRQTFQQEPSPPPLSGTHVTDIHYVSTSVPEWMRFPCSLCDSLAHFTYQCPLIVEYRASSINPYSKSFDHLTSCDASTPPIPSPDTVNITSPEPESLPTPPWFMDRLSEDIPPNPPNSPVHFPQEILPPTTVYPPQCLDIWFMSSEPSQHGCDIPSMSSPLEDNHTVTVTHVTSTDPLYSRIFHCDEDILEELTTPDFPWNVLHHRALFLSQEAFDPPSQASICAIETKDFIPSGHIDWFNNPIPTPDAFEEGNMANISPTVKIDISIKPRIIEEITIGAACSPEELTTYKALFQEYRDIFSWSYTEMPDLDPSIVEHRIDTWPDVTPVRQKQCPLHPSKPLTQKLLSSIHYSMGTNEVALWAHQPYIVPFSKLPHSVTGAQSLCFPIHLQPWDQGPAIYTVTFPGSPSELGPRGAFFSHHVQVCMLMFKIIK
jgi:hypothetical protein